MLAMNVTHSLFAIVKALFAEKHDITVASSQASNLLIGQVGEAYDRLSFELLIDDRDTSKFDKRESIVGSDAIKQYTNVGGGAVFECNKGRVVLGIVGNESTRSRIDPRYTSTGMRQELKAAHD